MKWEIERKFLVNSDEYKKYGKPDLYIQGYLSIDKNRTVRIRVVNEKSYVTIKGKVESVKGLEYEYEIPLLDGQEMLSNLCEKPLIKKYRFTIDYKGYMWEIDEFMGENEGLIIAEIELISANQKYEKPNWIGNEVTNDHRYSNSNLTRFPYNKWSN